MQYMRSVQFIMDRANWLTNILLGGVCLIIPIIGPIAMHGYMFEVIDALHNDPEHKEYPDFDFNRFMDYLTRGIWSFLMSLVIGLIIGVPLGIFCGCLMAVGIGIASSTKSPAVMLVFQLLMFLLAIAVIFLALLVSWPATLQAGLKREFDFPGMIQFVKDFNKLVIKEMLLSALFVFLVGIFALVVGGLTCGIGLMFTGAAASMAAYHILFQLYELYLERGGTPVEPKPIRESGREDRLD